MGEDEGRGCVLNKISSNTIISKKHYVLSSAKVTTIKSDKISKAGSYGIYVSSATAKNIQSNTLKSSKKYGIEILSIKNKVIVTKNKFSKSKSGKLKVKAK